MTGRRLRLQGVGGPKRILVVDDQPANLALLRHVLSPAGFEVREARSGADALAIAQEIQPDLILLDMHLPDMHGLDVMRRLRDSAWGARLRVAAISALANPEDQKLWRQSGCIAVLEKPIDIRTIVQDVVRLLGSADDGSEEALPDLIRTGRQPGAGRGDRLGEVLLAHDLISQEELDRAVAAQRQSGRRLGQVLVEQGVVNEDDIAWALSAQLGYPYVFLNPDIIDQEAARLLPERFLRDHRVLPILRFAGEMTLAMADPTDQQTIDDVGTRTGLQVKRSLALASNIEEMHDRLFAPAEARPASATVEAQYLQFHLLQALQQGASEIHFDPTAEGAQARVRYRLQGVLVDRSGQPAELHAAILAHLRRLLEAGENPVSAGGKPLPVGDTDVYVGAIFLPTAAGPSATVTISPRRADVPDLTPLGISPQEIRPLRTMVAASRGVILVGCGDPFLRATLLHALVPTDRPGKVWALEMLPAYARPTINQTVLRFPDEAAPHLQAALRAGADIILVDDTSGASGLFAAHQAGRTRIVLAAHPQDDTVGLLSQAVESAGPALVASTLAAVLAARPIRLLCPACKRSLSGQDTPEENGGGRWFTQQGCESCSFTGFRGQRLLVELWVIDGETRHLLRSGRVGEALDRAFHQVGSHMREQGRALLADGLTSPLELARVVDGGTR